MLSKTLNINGKVLLGVFSVVLLITGITMVQVVFSAPGGNGRVKGTSCMAQCLKMDAITFDSSKPEVQYCKSLCMPPEEEGTCLVTKDGCCVLQVDPTDPDCIENEICNDGKDNDGDGDIDCEDSDCPTVTIEVFDLNKVPQSGVLVGIDCNTLIGTTNEDGVWQNCTGLILPGFHTAEAIVDVCVGQAALTVNEDIDSYVNITIDYDCECL